VPVLLALTWLAIYLGKRLKWGSPPSETEVVGPEASSAGIETFDRGKTVDLV
jgi:hypothetical protein